MSHSYDDHPRYLDNCFDAPWLPQRSSRVGCSSALIDLSLKSRRQRVASTATAPPTSPSNNHSTYHKRTLSDLLSPSSEPSSEESLSEYADLFPPSPPPTRSCSLTAWWTAPSSPSESPTVPSFLPDPTSSFITTPTSPFTGLFRETPRQTEEISLRWPMEDTDEPEGPSTPSDTFFLDQLQRVRQGSAVGYERERVLKWFRRDWVERSLGYAMLMEDLGDEDDVWITAGHVGAAERPEVRWCEVVEGVEGVVEECDGLSRDEEDGKRTSSTHPV